MRYLLFLFCLTALACGSTKRVASTEVRSDTVKVIEYRDRLIEVQPAFSDTLVRWDSLKINVPVYVQDSSSQARLRLMRTRYNQLQAKCESRPAPVQVTDTVVQERIVYREKKTQETTRKRNRWGWAEWLLIGLAMGAGVWAYFKIRKR